jgi:hypothetical protein
MGVAVAERFSATDPAAKKPSLTISTNDMSGWFAESEKSGEKIVSLARRAPGLEAGQTRKPLSREKTVFSVPTPDAGRLSPPQPSPA